MVSRCLNCDHDHIHKPNGDRSVKEKMDQLQDESWIETPKLVERDRDGSIDEEQYLWQDWNARSAAKGWVVQKLSMVGRELALMIRVTEIPTRIRLGTSRTRSPHHTLVGKRDCDANGIGRRSKEAATLLHVPTRADA